MANKKRLQIMSTEQMLLIASAGDLIPELEQKPKAAYVKQKAFAYYSKNTKEIFHVQVIVTRCKSDFIDDFTTEVMY